MQKVLDTSRVVCGTYRSRRSLATSFRFHDSSSTTVFKTTNPE